MRLAYGWRVSIPEGFPAEVLREFIRPVVRSVPRSLAARLGTCRIALAPRLEDPSLASRWDAAGRGLAIELATEDVQPHDLALELLVCLGQAFFETSTDEEIAAYQRLLDAEFEARVTGEIDEDAFRAKCSFLGAAGTARQKAYDGFVRASLAGTLAEYVHSLWHDVTIRTGPEHLPAECLRRRFHLLAQWFPPDRGQKLFAEADQEEP
jgi:hypothetical protein